LDPDLRVRCFHNFKYRVFLAHVSAHDVAALYDMLFSIRHDPGLARQNEPEFVGIVEVRFHGVALFPGRASHCHDAALDLAPPRCAFRSEITLSHDRHANLLV